MPPAQAQVVPSMHCHVFVVSSWSLQQQVRVSCCLPGADGWLLGRACSSKGSAGADPGSGTDTSTKSCQMLLCGEALMSAEPLLDDFPWFLGRFRAEAGEGHLCTGSCPGGAAAPPCWQPHSHTLSWQQSCPLPPTANKGRAEKSQQGLEGNSGVIPWPMAGNRAEFSPWVWEEATL